MANISTIAITTASVGITATQWGYQITVQESPGVTNFPSVQLEIFKPSATSSGSTGPRVLSTGQSYSFQKGDATILGYKPGDVVGWVSTLSGSSVLVIDEQGS
jgi:hypothetical protein